MAVPVPNHISARVSLMQVSQLPSASSAQEIPIPEPLVQVTRGAITESRHRGHIVAVEPGGKIVALLGAPETVTFLRSSAKPHQAIPLIASGLLTALDLPRKRLHLPGSHSGESIHTEVAASMLRKIGLGPDSLKCGIQREPFSPEVAKALREQATAKSFRTTVRKACWHVGCSFTLYAPPRYDEASNPAQLEIARVISQFSGILTEDLAVGVDGCGVPVFGVTVRLALMYARLISPPQTFDEKIVRLAKGLFQR